MPGLRETDLYAPVKAHLEAAGYEVKAEIGPADVVGVAGGDLVVVELKTGFSLTLLQQAVARQKLTDIVFVAVPRWTGRAGWRSFRGNVDLCKRLGLGVLSVRLEDGFVQTHAAPAPFTPRKAPARRARLLSEFVRRDGDPNLGGTRGKVVTAYRQDAERLARYLAAQGDSKGAVVAKATGVARATEMMRVNHYGWFEKVATGVYRLSVAGLEKVDRFEQEQARPAAEGLSHRGTTKD